MKVNMITDISAETLDATGTPDVVSFGYSGLSASQIDNITSVTNNYWLDAHDLAEAYTDGVLSGKIAGVNNTINIDTLLLSNPVQYFDEYTLFTNEEQALVNTFEVNWDEEDNSNSIVHRGSLDTLLDRIDGVVRTSQGISGVKWVMGRKTEPTATKILKQVAENKYTSAFNNIVNPMVDYS